MVLFSPSVGGQHFSFQTPGVIGKLTSSLEGGVVRSTLDHNPTRRLGHDQCSEHAVQLFLGCQVRKIYVWKHAGPVFTATYTSPGRNDSLFTCTARLRFKRHRHLWTKVVVYISVQTGGTYDIIRWCAVSFRVWPVKPPSVPES